MLFVRGGLLLALPLAALVGEAADANDWALIQRRIKFSNIKVSAAEPDLHFIYTVGCDHYQLVQAVVCDHSWKEVGNQGRLTRIVVDCKNKSQRELLHSSPLKNDERFAVFFARGDLMMVPGTDDRYPARGRPYAIAQWLEAAKPQESTVAILDPDFVFLRPFSSHPDLTQVRPGKMLAQRYDLGTDWLPGFQYAGEANASVSFAEATDKWATGPPWILDMQDLRRMLGDWGRYTDSWPAEKGLLREQDSFCMAAYRHNIPAQGQHSFMVSNPLAWHEAWSEKDSQPGDWAPYVLHYCQTYSYGQWSFYKSLIADDYYAGQSSNAVPGPLHCGAPLLQEPPRPPAEENDRLKMKQAWMLSKLLPAMNKAFTAYRELYCAFGHQAHQQDQPLLMRTMQPQTCGTRTSTRYRVEPGAAASWDGAGAAGGHPCAPAAQAPLL